MGDWYCGIVWYLKQIVLTTINAKWIHPSLALRLLKANLGALEDSCEIIEFALRQPLEEKLQPLIAAQPYILGISVSIWNHLATIELLQELEKAWIQNNRNTKPIVVLGGPEVSHLPQDAKIFCYADYIIRGEGEIAFRTLCENLLTQDSESKITALRPLRGDFIFQEPVNLNLIKSAYHLYTDEDIAKKLIYVESSRDCLFNCEFCLSAVNTENKVREFPLEEFLAEMDTLVKRGVKTFKFLDRTFNWNIKRALRIIDFFLEKIDQRKAEGFIPPVTHFEIVPSICPPQLREAFARFPPDTLRLEIGIQTLNTEVSLRIKRPANPAKELEVLSFLREKTNAIIHADLIAGLPGEDLASFGNGFDRLWSALSGFYNKPDTDVSYMEDLSANHSRAEIQLGILKLLPGTPIARHNKEFGMRCNILPPYEVEETASVSSVDLQRLKNFARFWELIVNRNLNVSGWLQFAGNATIFNKFMILSDTLLAHFGKNWGIDKKELKEITEINMKRMDDN